MTIYASYLQMLTWTLKALLNNTCASTSMRHQDASHGMQCVECNGTMVVTGRKALQFLKVQSWVCPGTWHCRPLLSSSGSGRGHSQSGRPLHWLRLSSVACHPEKMACFVCRWNGYWENGRQFRKERGQPPHPQRKWGKEQVGWLAREWPGDFRILKTLGWSSTNFDADKSSVSGQVMILQGVYGGRVSPRKASWGESLLKPDVHRDGFGGHLPQVWTSQLSSGCNSSEL